MNSEFIKRLVKDVPFTVTIHVFHVSSKHHYWREFSFSFAHPVNLKHVFSSPNFISNIPRIFSTMWIIRIEFIVVFFTSTSFLKLFISIKERTETLGVETQMSPKTFLSIFIYRIFFIFFYCSENRQTYQLS